MAKIMTDFYLIRHGQTAWNRDRVFRGRIDVPLDDTGRREAEAVAQWLADVELNHIYSSPLSRAAETATILARNRGITVRKLEGLQDIEYGKWQGLPEIDVRRSYPALIREWETSPHQMTFPEGESLASVRARSLDCIHQLTLHHPGETLALVSHRVVLKVLCLALLGLPDSQFWHIQQDTCCINRFRMDGRSATVLLLNDTCHLKGLQRDTAGVDF
ncbi:MAG: histidine phosphatase family protein [Deltaproteobacteria bacterium]|nr:histidine phosphatase family protein [Deltaproteobacteria bacterium]